MLKTIASRFIRLSFAKQTPIFRFSQNNDNKDHNIQIKSSMEEIKTSQAVAKSIGMNQFLMKVYNTTGLSILGAIGSSFLFMSMPLVMANLITCIPGAAYMKPTKVVEQINGEQIYKTTNSIARKTVYSLGILGMGLASTQLFLMAQAVSPSIIPTAFGITTAIFGGASLMAYSMPRDKMLGYGRILSGSLLGLLGLQIIGLLGYAFMGPNPYSQLLFQADNYLGIGLFTFFIAYDTHLAIKKYELKEADHLGLAIEFLLDFWNILIRIIQIMAKNKK